MPCHDPDHMDCPVLCDCGKWAELDNTRLPPGEISGKTICDDCYQDALENEDIEIDVNDFSENYSKWPK